MEKDMEKEKNIQIIQSVNYHLKVNFYMEKEMEKENYMIMMVNYFLKENL